MRVVFASASCGPHDRRFLAAAMAAGHEVWHVRLGSAGSGDDWTDSPVGDRRRSIPDAPLHRTLEMLRPVLEEIRPDVVHAGPIQRVGFPVVLSTSAPIIAMSWGSDLLLAGATDPVWRDVGSFVLARSRLFIADCAAVAESARALGYVGEIVQFPWGIDVEKFSPTGRRARFTDDDETVIVLSTRNWEPVYDVSTLARAFARIWKGSGRLHLVLAGTGSGENELRTILREATEAGRVTWLGRVENDRLPTIYRSANLYVSTSRCDGTSISLLEAMGCGLPTVVTDIPSNREWVVSGKNGALFTAGDPNALERVLLDFAQAPASARRRAGTESRGVVEGRGNWSVNQLLLWTAYEDAIR